MTFSSSNLDQLIERLANTDETLNKVDNALADTVSDIVNQRKIAESVITELVTDWVSLDAQFASQKDLQTIQQAVERVVTFVDALHRIVLAPRRIAVETGLRRWLKKWTLRLTSIDPFLHTANDAQLDKLSALIAQNESFVLSDDAVKTRVSRWLSYQISELRRLDRRPDILEDQLRHIRDTLQSAVTLETSLKRIGTIVEAQTNDLAKIIAQQWLDAQRKGLTIGQIEIAELDLDNRRTNLENNWRKLDSSLLALRAALQSLNLEEHQLAESYVKRHGSWTSEEIDSISSSLRQIVQLRKEITETPQLVDNGIVLEKPSIEVVVHLQSTRPELPVAIKGESLISYKEKLAKVRDALKVWLKEFEDVVDDLQIMHTRWHDLAVRRELIKIVTMLSVAETEPETLSQLIELHNTVVIAIGTIRARLKANLSTDEQQVLDHILHLVDVGRDRIDAQEFAEQLNRADALALLARLAEQRLIRLDIIP